MAHSEESESTCLAGVGWKGQYVKQGKNQSLCFVTWNQHTLSNQNCSYSF